MALASPAMFSYMVTRRQRLNVAHASRMRTLHRLIAPLTALALLMLTLQANGAVCVRHDLDATAGTSLQASPRMAHAPMTNGAQRVETMPAMDHHARPAPDVPQDHHPDPCSGGDAPRDCASMLSCASMTAIPAVVARLAVGSLPRIVVPAPSAAHPAPVGAPELPPPRA